MRYLCMRYLMPTPAQRSSVATVPPIAVMKWISPLSMMDYLPSLDSFTNIQIISGDMNAQTGKVENNKSVLHILPNRNSEYLTDFSLVNSLNTKFQKERENHGSTPFNAKAQLDYKQEVDK